MTAFAATSWTAIRRPAGQAEAFMRAAIASNGLGTTSITTTTTTMLTRAGMD